MLNLISYPDQCSSNNIYNQSLVASFIAHHGEDTTQAWANKFVDNFARKPQGGDRDQVKAVAAGQCAIAVVNSYYLGKMINGSEDEQTAAAKVKLFWPNQETTLSFIPLVQKPYMNILHSYSFN